MSKPAILCIDDEHVVLTGLRAQLKREFGNDFRIEVAESGEEAMEIVNELIDAKTDLPVVISDQIMPGMKGDELLTFVHQKLHRTHNIMLTGQADAAAVGRALNNAGLYRFISKPWDETDLNLTVREAIKSYLQGKTILEQNIQLEELVVQLKDYNERLEETVQVRTSEVVSQKKIIEEKNESITSSIRYAQKIQRAVLPPEKLIKRYFPESFVMYEPRDIVSGDFYWITKIDNKIIATAADCTGHGVPGGFMSMLGMSFLNELVNRLGITEPDKILNALRENILGGFHADLTEEDTKDGIDMVVITWNPELKNIEFAGAYNPLLIVRNGEVITIKGDRMPVGHYAKMKDAFTKQVVEIQNGDVLYMLSDGYTDQFGGPDEKKFMMKNFKDMILNINHLSLPEQKAHIERVYLDWKGKGEQIDDIVVFAIRFDNL